MALDRREPVGREVHEAIMEKFRTYLLVGGTPFPADREEVPDGAREAFRSL